MAPQNEEVTVRRLPGGLVHKALYRTLSGRRLELEPQAAAVSDLPMGALVEVTSVSHIYFGEIKGWDNHLMVVGIEHAVECSALARITQVWGQ